MEGSVVLLTDFESTLTSLGNLLKMAANCYFRNFNNTWYCLSSSIGGCAPYVSSFGMLRSSTKIIIRLPAGAPRTTARTRLVEYRENEPAISRGGEGRDRRKTLKKKVARLLSDIHNNGAQFGFWKGISNGSEAI